MAGTSRFSFSVQFWNAVAAFLVLNGPRTWGAIAALLGGHGRRAAFERARAWSEEHAVDEVQEWLEGARNRVPIDFQSSIGFVKIAFTNAFQHLLEESSYEEAIRETLLGGGDTDTNSCIAGGLIGAAVGEENIPESMRRAVLECDTSLGQPRPPFLHPNRVPELVNRLLNEGPSLARPV